MLCNSIRVVATEEINCPFALFTDTKSDPRGSNIYLLLLGNHFKEFLLAVMNKGKCSALVMDFRDKKAGLLVF